MSKMPIRPISFLLYLLLFGLMLSVGACEEAATTEGAAEASKVQPTPPAAQEEVDQVVKAAPSVAAENGVEAAGSDPSVDLEQEGAQRPAAQRSYDLSKPKKNCKLPKELREISGLSYDATKNELIAINDERAFIYRLNLDDCRVEGKADFGKKGDYEGVEKVGNTTYVLKSNGNLYAFKPSDGDEAATIKTALSEENDVEGLGYDPVHNELMLACKGAPQLPKKSRIKGAKAVYAFDLDKEELQKKPLFVLKDKNLKDFFEKLPSKSSKEKDKRWDRLKSFAPSAIARHPVEGDYYILSTVGKLLVVVSRSGQLRKIEFLKDKLFTQPEGICFAPDATLYVSNEGRSHSATILRFDYK
ncbi:MAG: SdiA-regulated domain-containing protein [Bacteroidota bacterium]